MFIRVLLEKKEEGLFNADCQVAFLLDAIKRKHKIPPSETIDLCTLEGSVKKLYLHGNDNATTFFKLRELCLTVKVQDPESTRPYYTPILNEYRKNQEFIDYLNHSGEAASCCVRARLKNNPNIIRTKTPVDASKLLAANKGKKRRGSALIRK